MTRAIFVLSLALIVAAALPKNTDLRADINLAEMNKMHTALTTSRDFIRNNIEIFPGNMNIAQNRYRLKNGEKILIRGRYPDGRWSNTFSHLVDFSDVAFTQKNICEENDKVWCVKHTNLDWFIERGYSNGNEGRGFVIFPKDFNVNKQRCYLYYFNPNHSNDDIIPIAPEVVIDSSDC